MILLFLVNMIYSSLECLDDIDEHSRLFIRALSNPGHPTPQRKHPNRNSKPPKNDTHTETPANAVNSAEKNHKEPIPNLLLSHSFNYDSQPIDPLFIPINNFHVPNTICSFQGDEKMLSRYQKLVILAQNKNPDFLSDWVYNYLLSCNYEKEYTTEAFKLRIAVSKIIAERFNNIIELGLIFISTLGLTTGGLCNLIDDPENLHVPRNLLFKIDFLTFYSQNSILYSCDFFINIINTNQIRHDLKSVQSFIFQETKNTNPMKGFIEEWDSHYKECCKKFENESSKVVKSF